MIIYREKADGHDSESYRTDVHESSKGNQSTEAYSGTTYVLIIP